MIFIDMKRMLSMLVTSLLILSMTVQSAANSHSSRVKLIVCLDIVNNDGIEKLIDVYCSTHWGTTVDVQNVPANEPERSIFIKDIKEELTSGKGPDLFMINNGTPYQKVLFPDVEKSVEDGMFYNLGYTRQNKLYNDVLPDSAHSVGVVDGKRFILPLSYTVAGVVSTTDRLKQYKIDTQDAGSSRDSFYNQISSLPANLATDCLEMLYHPLLTDFAQNLYIESGEYTNTILDAIVFSDCIADDHLLNANETDLMNDTRLLSGEIPMLGGKLGFGTPLMYQLYELTKSDDKPLFIPLPNENGNVTARVSLWAGINANSSNITEATHFINYLLDESFQHEITNNGFPIRKGCLTHVANRNFVENNFKTSGNENIVKQCALIEMRIDSIRFDTPEEFIITSAIREGKGKALEERLDLIDIQLTQYKIDQIMGKLLSGG